MALKITQKKGVIGTKPQHRSNLQSLGLRRIGHSVVQPDTASVRGMVNVVRHLVVVEEVAGE